MEKVIFIRVPQALHNAVQRAAANEGVSVNKLLNDLLIKEYDAYHYLTDSNDAAVSGRSEESQDTGNSGDGLHSGTQPEADRTGQSEPSEP